MMTADEVGNVLRIGPWTVHKLRRNGLLKGKKVGNARHGTYKFHEKSVTAYINFRLKEGQR